MYEVILGLLSLGRKGTIYFSEAYWCGRNPISPGWSMKRRVYWLTYQTACTSYGGIDPESQTSLGLCSHLLPSLSCTAGFSLSAGCLCAAGTRESRTSRLHPSCLITKEEREFLPAGFNEENPGEKCEWVLVRSNEYLWTVHCGWAVGTGTTLTGIMYQKAAD